MLGHWFGLFLFFLQVCIGAQNLHPQIANSKFATNNPTLTTITLEKPFCVFDGLMSKGAFYKVYLYAMVDPASTSRPSVIDNASKPLSATFQQTNGGQTGPYRAAVFSVPNCSSSPKLSDAVDEARATGVLSDYLVRVGNDTACLYDPNFVGVCNPPLSQDTAYRFKYLLVDTTALIMKDETLWSRPIKTQNVKQSSTIDTWPGRRSGGMIVITSILSALMGLLVLGFVAAVLSAVMPAETSTETRYESQITQHPITRVQETSDPEI
uniref:Uroplakin 3A n=1 Tax=Salvator merianae TaxID=96440 RepID=A0A8D0BQ44_SALMN